MDLDEQYTSICSAVTLQSNKKGFFLDFAETVIDLGGDTFLNEFQNLSTDRERIQRFYGDSEFQEGVQEVLRNILPVFRGKAAKLSQLRRQEGEKLTKDGLLDRALVLLSQAVIRAPIAGEDKSVDDGLSLPLALWSRAQTLWQLSEFKLCLADIQLAMKEKLPDSLRVRAYWTQAGCYQKLGEISRAKISLQVTLKLLDDSKTDWRVKVENELLKLKDVKDSPVTETLEEEELLFGEHPLLTGLSSVLAQSSTEKGGRHIVACHQINSGDVVAKEKPYVACLLPDKFGSHCHHCFKRLKVAVPCRECAGVAFCSVSCRDEAATYHKFECHFMDLLIGSGMSILCHIALRVITQEKYTYWRRLFNKQPVTPDYSRLAGLVTHADKRPPKDFIKRTLMALFLLSVLENSKYIPPTDCNERGKISGMQLFLGTVLLHLLQCLQFNAHEIYETVYKGEMEFAKSKVNHIGVGIYPSVALFNHDCYPAVARYFRGKELVLSALRPINAKEMVTENYGPVYSLKPKEERIRSLAARYWFTCECTACTEDWPTSKQLDENTIHLRCQGKKCDGFTTVTKEDSQKRKVKCSKCGGIINVSEALLLVNSYNDDLERGFAFMSEGKLKEAVQIFTTYCNVMYTVVRPPHKKYVVTHEAIRSCLAYPHNKFIIK